MKLYVLSDVDKELKRVLESVMPDYDYYGDNGRTMNAMQQSTQSLQQSWSECATKLSAIARQFSAATGGASVSAIQEIQNSIQDRFSGLSNVFPDTSRSKLTNEKKAEIRRLVDVGASLQGIEALHFAAAKYKTEDLFDLLIDEYGMDVNSPDEKRERRPLHVAATSTKNVDGLRILLAKGANKNLTNIEGETALQEMNDAEFSGYSAFAGGTWQDTAEIRRLLNEN